MCGQFKGSPRIRNTTSKVDRNRTQETPIAVVQLVYDTEDVPWMEFVYLVFTCMPGKCYCRKFRSLLFWCDIFRALINSLVC